MITDNLSISVPQINAHFALESGLSGENSGTEYKNVTWPAIFVIPLKTLSCDSQLATEALSFQIGRQYWMLRPNRPAGTSHDMPYYSFERTLPPGVGKESHLYFRCIVVIERLNGKVACISPCRGCEITPITLCPSRVTAIALVKELEPVTASCTANSL